MNSCSPLVYGRQEKNIKKMQAHIGLPYLIALVDFTCKVSGFDVLMTRLWVARIDFLGTQINCSMASLPWFWPPWFRVLPQYHRSSDMCISCLVSTGRQLSLDFGKSLFLLSEIHMICSSVVIVNLSKVAQELLYVVIV